MLTKPYEEVTDTASLDRLCKAVSVSSFVAIDTEFERQRTYYADLCLIQVATDELTALIDPLAYAIDLSPLFKLLSDPSITKVFHASRQDIEIFYRRTGQVPTPVFDTQVAASFYISQEQISYGSLVQHHFDIALDKRWQRSNWRRRPLPLAQKDYAASDVYHLVHLYHVQQKELAARGRADWLAEEQKKIHRPELYCIDPKEAYKRLRSVSSPLTRSILKDLAAWREQQAQERNFPRQWVVTDALLLALAKEASKAKPHDEASLMKPMASVSSAYKEGLSRCLVQSLSHHKDSAFGAGSGGKKQPPPNKMTALRFELLCHLLAQVSQCEQISESRIATRAELQDLARDEGAPDFLRGWRYEVFGRLSLELLSGTLGLWLSDGGVRFGTSRSVSGGSNALREAP